MNENKRWMQVTSRNNARDGIGFRLRPSYKARVFPIPIIDAAARKRGLQYLLIGGHAINVYVSPRATLDVDFLVKKDDRERWCEFLTEEGFKLFHDGKSFLQFNPPYGTSFRLDLMLVNLQTFEKLRSAAHAQRVLGVEALVPAAEHLIALKLHALKFGHAERHDKDFSDVVALSRSIGFDPHSAAFRDLFEQFGTKELYERVLQRLK